MLRSRRESHHRNGITDLNPLQQTSATKSAISRLMHRSINRIDLFDHIVGTSEDIWRDFEAEYLGGLKIDDEFEARRLFDW